MAGTTQRTDLDLDAYKAQLLELKKSSEETINSMREQDGDGLNTSGTERSELSNADNHPADVATELQLRGQDDALIENERSTLRQIERALEKLADGSYGISDQSGALIPKERLDLVPYANLTVEEASANESPSYTGTV